MMLYEIRYLFDAALVILIWVTQVIIYPGFKFMDPERFNGWHRRYTRRMSAIVLPLMLGQFGIVIFQAANTPDWYTLISLVLVSIPGLITIFEFAPLHNQLARSGFNLSIFDQLVKKNWKRTMTWSGVLLLDILFLIFR